MITDIESLKKYLVDYIRGAEFLKDVGYFNDSDVKQVTRWGYTYDDVSAIVKDAEDVVSEFLSGCQCQFDSDNPCYVGKYKLEYVCGYTGYEGGGEDVKFIANVIDGYTGTTLCTLVFDGYYSSYDGLEYDSVVVVEHVVETPVSKTLVEYKSGAGEILYSYLK